MSVSQFARDNEVYFEFHPFLCFVKDIQTRKTLLVGHMHNGLYRFNVSSLPLRPSIASSQSTSTFLCTAQLSPPPELWHKRLGYPCSNALGVVLRNCNIPFNLINVSSIYSACQLSKAHKLPFSSSKTLYSSHFELVESNI